MPIETYKPGEKVGSFGLCIYGRGGTGKTTLVGTMPGRGLVIDVPQIEGGTFVIADKADRIDITSVTEWKQIDPVYWYLRKEKHDYNWVAVDSITAMQELAKRKVIKERDLGSDPHKVSLPEWGQVGQLVGELVYRFRTLPLTTIWVAQERHNRNEDEPMTIGPDVIPSALAALFPSMMLVGRLSVAQDAQGEWQRTLRVGTHPLYLCKSRARPGKRLPPLVAKPNLNTIMRYLLADGPAPEAVEEMASAFIME